MTEFDEWMEQEREDARRNLQARLLLDIIARFAAAVRHSDECGGYVPKRGAGSLPVILVHSGQCTCDREARVMRCVRGDNT